MRSPFAALLAWGRARRRDGAREDGFRSDVVPLVGIEAAF